jgi:plasmid stability protein
MATIMLRDIPDELMEEIKKAAALERRSVPAEVLHLTEIGVRKALLQQRPNAEVVEIMRKRLLDMPRIPVSSTELIAEDRQR